MTFSNLSKTIALCLGVLLMVFLTEYFVFAQVLWTNPSKDPPEGNVDLPLNTGPNGTGSTGQVKSVGLLLNASPLPAEKGLVVLGKTVAEVSPGVCPAGYDWWGLNAEKCQKTPLFVTYDGSVGIGIKDPLLITYPLTVNGAIAGTGYVNTAVSFTNVPVLVTSPPNTVVDANWYQNGTGKTVVVIAWFACPVNTYCGMKTILSRDKVTYETVDHTVMISSVSMSSANTVTIIVPAGWWFQMIRGPGNPETSGYSVQTL